MKKRTKLTPEEQRILKEIERRLEEIRKVVNDNLSCPPEGSFELGMYRGESWQLRSLRKFITKLK